MERPTPKKERPSGDNAAYLYKGSKVRNLVGGVNPTAAGNIHPIDARPITIQNYSGYVNTIYKSGVPASDTGKGQSSLNMRRIIAILQCKATIPVIPSTMQATKRIFKH